MLCIWFGGKGSLKALPSISSMQESRREVFVLISRNFISRMLLLAFLLRTMEVLGRDLESKMLSDDIFSVCSSTCKITSK